MKTTPRRLLKWGMVWFAGVLMISAFTTFFVPLEQPWLSAFRLFTGAVWMGIIATLYYQERGPQQ